MDLGIADFYNLYWGGIHVTSNSKYLWPNINEGTESGGSYEQKRKRAAYPNFQWKIVTIYKDYVLFGKPKIEDAPNFDVRQLAHDVIENMLIAGWCVILVLQSGPKVYEAFRVKKEDDGRIIIRGEQTGQLNITGKPKSTDEFDFFEIVPPGVQTERGDGTTSDQGRIFRVMNGEEETVEPFAREQFIKCAWNAAAVSLIRDTAQINIQVYNFYVVLDTLVLSAAVFNSFGPDISEGIKKIPPYTHIPLNSGETPFGFAGPPTEQMREVRGEITHRVMDMGSIVGLTREFSEQLRIDPSGLSLAFQMLDTNATVLQIAKGAMTCVNKAGEVNKQLNGGDLGHIGLDPLLTPDPDDTKLARLKNLESIQIDEVIKAAQTERVAITLSELPEGDRQKLFEIIKTKGGMAAIRKPELDFQI